MDGLYELISNTEAGVDVEEMKRVKVSIRVDAVNYSGPI